MAKPGKRTKSGSYNAILTTGFTVKVNGEVRGPVLTESEAWKAYLGYRGYEGSIQLLRDGKVVSELDSSSPKVLRRRAEAIPL